MDSKDFFKENGLGWKGKTGVYCIEQPVLNDTIYTNHTPIYKVGYARNSLYTRMSNYRTAYGVVPFKIHCLLEIPSGVVNNRTAFALLNEQRIHKTLKEIGLGSEANEWFYDLDQILKVMNSLRKELEKRISYAHKWKVYIDPKRTRYREVGLVPENTIRSKLFDGIEYDDRVKFQRKANFKGIYEE